MTWRGGGRGEPKVMAFSVLLTLSWYVLSRGDSRGWRVTLLPLPILPSRLGGKNLRHSEEVKLDREDEVKGTGLPLPCHLLQCETLSWFPTRGPPTNLLYPWLPPTTALFLAASVEMCRKRAKVWARPSDPDFLDWQATHVEKLCPGKLGEPHLASHREPQAWSSPNQLQPRPSPTPARWLCSREMLALHFHSRPHPCTPCESAGGQEECPRWSPCPGLCLYKVFALHCMLQELPCVCMVTSHTAQASPGPRKKQWAPRFQLRCGFHTFFSFVGSRTASLSEKWLMAGGGGGSEHSGNSCQLL